MIDLSKYDDVIDCILIPPDSRAPELGVAIRAALAAGEKVLEIYNEGDSKKEVREKEDGSPITKADIASHHILTTKLGRTGHDILSEEGKQNEERDETVWILDPLDGTSDFIDRTGEFTIMAALVRSGEPVLGVILWPVKSTIFVAQKRKGAYRHTPQGGWEKIRVSDVFDIAQCTMVGSRHHLSNAEKKFVKRLGVKEFVSVGSSLKACMIASGMVEAYVTTTDKIKEWDTAAAHIIVSEAGGIMTDARGCKITYGNADVRHRHGVMVTNGLIHDYVAAELKQEGIVL